MSTPISYPFPQAFHDAVDSHLDEWKTTWISLVYPQVTSYVDALCADGFEREQILKWLADLVEMTDSELLELAIADESKDTQSRPALVVLQLRDTDQLFQSVKELLKSPIAAARAVAVYVLKEKVGASHLEEARTLVTDLFADEHEACVIVALVYATERLKMPNQSKLTLGLEKHASKDVRLALAFALDSHQDFKGIDMLVDLTNDKEDEVRDWAVFGLGVLGSVNCPQVNDALFARMDDPIVEIRHQALEGLAKRRDRRALPVLVRELEIGWHGPMLYDAAKYLADPVLYPRLLACLDLDEPQYIKRALKLALRRCQPRRFKLLIADGVKLAGDQSIYRLFFERLETLSGFQNEEIEDCDDILSASEYLEKYPDDGQEECLYVKSESESGESVEFNALLSDSWQWILHSDSRELLESIAAQYEMTEIVLCDETFKLKIEWSE